MNIELILAIIETLAPLIADCFDNTPEGVSKLRRSPVRVGYRVALEARRDGMSRKDARMQGKAAVEAIQEATDEELMCVLSDCHEMAKTTSSHP